MNYNTLHKAERQVINHLIADNDLYWQYCPRLKDEFFTEHLNIFDAYKKVIIEGGKANIVSISKIMGEEYFTNLSVLLTEIQYDIDFETWIKYLEEETKKQKCLKILSKLSDAIQSEKIELIEPILQDALTDLSGDNIDHVNMIDHVKDLIKHIELVQTGQSITGFPTGILSYDQYTGGFHLTDLVIIAGETSQGKTTFALNIAYNNAIRNTYVGIFSLEMSLRQLTARLTAIDTNLSSKDILRGSQDLSDLNTKLNKIINNKILLDNTRNSNLESIISKMRYFISRFKCQLFFIDYLQLISYHKKGNSTEQNLADICRALKNFAKENNVTIVLLCQLNRDGQGGGEPKLSRLRGSGQIEEAADSVIFVQRTMPNQFGDPESARIIQQKGRNSGTGDFNLMFTGSIPSFTNA